MGPAYCIDSPSAPRSMTGRVHDPTHPGLRTSLPCHTVRSRYTVCDTCSRHCHAGKACHSHRPILLSACMAMCIAGGMLRPSAQGLQAPEKIPPHWYTRWHLPRGTWNWLTVASHVSACFAAQVTDIIVKARPLARCSARCSGAKLHHKSPA